MKLSTVVLGFHPLPTPHPAPVGLCFCDLAAQCCQAGGARALGRAPGAEARGRRARGAGDGGARRPARPAALGPESPRATESVSCAKAKLLEAEDRFHRNAVPCTERRILAAIRKYLKN